MGIRTSADYDSLWTLAALDAVTTMVLTQDFRHIELSVFSSSITTWYTLTVYGSDQNDRPDLSSAVSATNRYGEIQVVDKNDWNAITGTTGIVITANWLKKYEVNDNKSRWVGVKITAYTDGSSVPTINLADNS